MEPLPAGTVVDYHGSHAHGRYVITEHQDPETVFTKGELMLLGGFGTLQEAYPDGVAYVIWKQGVLQKFGNRQYMVSRVRRGSLTPVTEEK